MPIYPGRRKGTFRVTVWRGGKQHEEIFEGSKADALEHEARLRIELGAKGTRLKQRLAPLFSVFSTEDYRPHAKAHLGARTWRRSRRYYVKTLVEFFGKHRLDEIDLPLVDAFVRSRQAKSTSPVTINTELTVFKSMLRYASTLGYSVADLKIKMVRAPKGRLLVWSAEDVGKLLAAAKEKATRLWPFVVILVNTGMRKDELLAAPWTWVDERRRVIGITPYEGWSTKSGKPREVPLSDAAQQVLASLPRSSPWLFPNPDGSRRARFPDEKFSLVVKAAGLEGSPHTCRHTFASLFLAAGGSIWELAALLGHSATRTTELYGHLLPGHLERTRNLVDIGAGDKNPGGPLAKRRTS